MGRLWRACGNPPFTIWLPEGTGGRDWLSAVRNSVGRRAGCGGPDKDLYSRTLVTHRNNLISVEKLNRAMRVLVKIRHRHVGAMAMIESAGVDSIRVTFDEPQRAVTPGQAAVFYDGDVVVGGGWIA